MMSKPEVITTLENKKFCKYCVKSITYRKVCPSCQNKLYRLKHLEKMKAQGLKNGKRRIRYKTKTIYLSIVPKIGKCQNLFCIAKYKLTQMHHKKYNDNDPLLDTIELCVSCHSKMRKRRKIALCVYAD
jgi:hypothetical protein